jgi:hypothetical protein
MSMTTRYFRTVLSEVSYGIRSSPEIGMTKAAMRHWENNFGIADEWESLHV